MLFLQETAQRRALPPLLFCLVLLLPVAAMLEVSESMKGRLWDGTGSSRGLSEVLAGAVVCEVIISANYCWERNRLCKGSTAPILFINLTWPRLSSNLELSLFPVHPPPPLCFNPFPTLLQLNRMCSTLVPAWVTLRQSFSLVLCTSELYKDAPSRHPLLLVLLW